jgi:glycosyltransferase involved in cell wall biosynthesis
MPGRLQVRVIHLLTPEYPPKVGGVAAYTRQLARGLSVAGELVHVWCPEGESGDGFQIHPVLGGFHRADLCRTGVLLDEFPTPRRILVQWVPHGYSPRAMNLFFCLWLWRRAARGDRIELMVHEPYLNFREGNWRQAAAAAVHRVMTAILLRAATRVWMSVPAWEEMWRPWAFGRRVPFGWLPIPSALRQPDPDDRRRVLTAVAADGQSIVGHLGTYGRPVAALLEPVLADLLRRSDRIRVLLMGVNSDRFLESFCMRHPHLVDRITAAGPLDDASLSAHVAACDVLIQPYPDGLSSRRTTAMAGLRLGIPIVSTSGYLTEPLWEQSGAVRLVPVARAAGLADAVIELLAAPDVRARLARAGGELYDRVFDLDRTVAILTDSAEGRAAY